MSFKNFDLVPKAAACDIPGHHFPSTGVVVLVVELVGDGSTMIQPYYLQRVAERSEETAPAYSVRFFGAQRPAPESIMMVREGV